jgi:transposase
MHGDAFKTYTAEMLALTLTPCDIVVMENLPARRSQKVASIAEIIAQKKSQPFVLAPYSPDMSRAARPFLKLKAALQARAEPACTIDTLWRGIGIILDSFTPKHSTNYLQEARNQHSMGESARRFVFKLSWSVSALTI